MADSDKDFRAQNHCSVNSEFNTNFNHNSNNYGRSSNALEFGE